RVAQYLIGFIYPRKPVVRVGRSRNVWVIFARQPAIGGFDFSLGRASRKSENSVEIRHNLQFPIKKRRRSTSGPTTYARPSDFGATLKARNFPIPRAASDCEQLQ